MTFVEICKLSQNKLKARLENELTELGYSPLNEDGYLYAEGEVPVLLLAHMDTVHHDNCTIVCTSEDGNYVMSPQGIGGDDRCGIFMVLEIIKEYKCSVLFTEDEEKGCVGAHKFVNDKVVPTVPINYLLEFDRKNKNDAVFYSCDNKDFEAFITDEEIGFKTAYGSCSDISSVAPYLKTAAVNLSCGYYNAHTEHEYVKMSEMLHNIERAKLIIAKECEHFEYVEKTIELSNWGAKISKQNYDKDWYDKYYNRKDYLDGDDYDLYDEDDDYTGSYNDLYYQFFENGEDNIVSLFTEYYDIEVGKVDLIPLEELIDVDNFNVIMTDGGRPLTTREYKMSHFDCYDLYMDKKCHVYRILEDEMYGICIAIDTGYVLKRVDGERIQYYEDTVEAYYTMDENDYNAFYSYVCEWLDSDIEDWILEQMTGV